MKAIFSLVFISVLISYSNALSYGALENRAQLELGNVLKPILECLLNNLGAISSDDLPVIIDKIKSILLKIGSCNNINLSVANYNFELLQCFIGTLGQVSKEDLSAIVIQLQPILSKAQNVINCIRNSFQQLCQGLCNIPGITICDSSVMGLDLSQLIAKLLDPAVQTLFCGLLG
ncbi:hypothetical protein RN001_010068 [Aquatica leii]|uniref:Uncharacterized protein n=1 Tax=Aquatica leii TaxID=1421715 RepID=A0AAN7SE85_9COLE|nr:hypothetical protein RN001_010068 [Aquatica leii]